MSILDEARRVVDGPRPDVYGPPEKNHTCTARLWSAYLWRRLDVDVELNALDVCAMLRLLKESRLANDQTHLDSLIDIAGYARNAEMVIEANKIGDQ